VVTQVYVVLSHSQDIQMIIQPDALVVLLNPSLNETPSLSNVDLITFAGDVVNAKVILDKPKETGDLPR